MIVDSTIFSGLYATWRVRITPDGQNVEKNGYTKEELDQGLTKLWQPEDGLKWIFFNPKISIIAKSRKEPKHRIWIPTSLLYSLRDCIQTSYARLATKGLFYKKDRMIYCDKAEAQRQRIILPIPGGYSVLFEPTVIYGKDDEPKLGISLRSSSAPDAVILLPKTEAKELFTVLDHVDLNSYSAILAILEKLERLEDRTDKLLQGQEKLIQMVGKLINQQELSKVTIQPNPNQAPIKPQVITANDYEPHQNDDLPW